jgi:hypothetical protein
MSSHLLQAQVSSVVRSVYHCIIVSAWEHCCENAKMLCVNVKCLANGKSYKMIPIIIVKVFLNCQDQVLTLGSLDQRPYWLFHTVYPMLLPASYLSEIYCRILLSLYQKSKGHSFVLNHSSWIYLVLSDHSFCFLFIHTPLFSFSLGHGFYHLYLVEYHLSSGSLQML